MAGTWHTTWMTTTVREGTRRVGETLPCHRADPRRRNGKRIILSYRTRDGRPWCLHRCHLTPTECQSMRAQLTPSAHTPSKGQGGGEANRVPPFLWASFSAHMTTTAVTRAARSWMAMKPACGGHTSRKATARVSYRKGHRRARGTHPKISHTR